MRHGIWGLSLALGLSLMGCSSTIRSECQKASECDELNGQSVDDCVSDAETDRKRYENDSNCSTILAKSEAWADCTAGLSCDDRQKLLSNDYKCKDEAQAVSDAIRAANGRCSAISTNP